MPIHPMISLFKVKAEVMDATGDRANLDDAISLLAGWIDLEQDGLSEDNMTVLSNIGAIMFREARLRRM